MGAKIHERLVVEERFEYAKRLLIWLGMVAAISVMTLVWATNGPETRSQTIVVVPPSSSPQL